MTTRLTLAAIRAAHARIRDKIHRTPVLTSSVLDELSGCALFFKCENFQKVGVFKARGAANAVFSLTDTEAARGVVTHSSGNHGAALAWAASLRGIPAYVVVPENAPRAKAEAIRRYGAQITFCESNVEARERSAQIVLDSTGATLIHPYDDLRVMAGQGTSVLELIEDVSDLEAIVCPVGGGGQLSGGAVAAKGLNPGMWVFGAEPAVDPDSAHSLKSGYVVQSRGIHTLADGLRTSLSELTFAEIQSHVDDILTVSEEEIVAAMRKLWEVLKVLVEPSGAVAFAAALASADRLRGKKVGVILSGGNLDLDRLPWQGN